MSEWWKSSAEHVDFAEQERIYREQTGDKPWFVGFESRFAVWCEKHPRRELATTNRQETHT